MANNLSGWPWVVDTPGASALVLSGWKLHRIRWVSPSASPGDLVLITDRSARTIWASVAPGDNFVESDLFDNGYAIDGLVVPTLGSGILYVYFVLQGNLRLP